MKKKLFIFIVLISNLFSFSQTSFGPTSQPLYYDFARQLDIHNDDIIVSSASFMVPDFSNFGKTFIFSIENSVLLETAALQPTDATNLDDFGNTVSIWDDFAAIGARLHDAAGTDAGAVYLYRKINNNWEFFQKVVAFDAQPNDHFGDVKLRNGQLFIGSPNDEQDSSNNTANEGSIYVYDFNGTQWDFSQKLTVPGSSLLGGKIEVENNRLVVRSSDALNTFYYNSTWQFGNQLILESGSGQIGDFSLSEDNLYVINTSTPSFDSRVFPFTAGTNIWNPELPINITANVNFGDQVFSRIEVNQNRMFLGSTGYILQFPRQFPVLYYQKLGGTWQLQQVYNGTGQGDAGLDDYFGAALATSDNYVIIGAPDEHYYPEGRAYYMELPSLGTSGFDRSIIQIFPNPAEKELFVSTKADFEISTAKIYNIAGQLLATHTLDLNRIPVEDLTPGIYFLYLQLANGSEQSYKFIKE